MIQERSTALSALIPSGHVPSASRASAIVAAIALGLLLVISTAGLAQPVDGTQSDTRNFFRGIVGEWIGTCEQSTDGQKAENKYFHGVIRQSGPNEFSSRFSYYRMDDKKGVPVAIGESTIITTLLPDGSAQNKITGNGVMLVNKQPKNQQHELIEVVHPSSGGLQGQGSGKISVNGMPLGVGKNGKIRNAKSAWVLQNDVLTINQTLTAAFRAFIFGKSFGFTANYTAQRGTNVASLMARRQASAQ